MATPKSTHGYGTKLYRETDIEDTFEEVAGVRDLTPPESSGETVSATNHSSPDGVHEKLPGLIDPGEMPVTLAFDPSDEQQAALIADHYGRENRRYRFETPNGLQRTFTAWPSSFGQETPLEDVMTQTFTFAVSGKPDDVVTP